MKRISFLCLLTGAGVLAANAAHAEGTFVPAAQRTDMVYDASRDILYIANGDRVLRYRVGDATFEAPIVLGGQLEGIDLSPDGTTLAVGDDAKDASMYLQVHMVNLDTLQDHPVERYPGYLDKGTYSVAFQRNGTLLATTQVDSGQALLFGALAEDPGTTFTLGFSSVVNASRISMSGNGLVVGLGEPDVSGSWLYYNEPLSKLLHFDARYVQDGLTGSPNREVAVNPDGSQLAMVTDIGVAVLDPQAHRLATLGQAGDSAIGGAYDPVQPLAYFPWAGTRQLRVYAMDTFQLQRSYDFEDDFNAAGETGFNQGRTRISRDGSLLMVAVTGGVRILRMFAPLAADDIAVTSSGKRTDIPLAGHIGNEGALGYELALAPAHGKVFIEGDHATYVPAPGYSGEDSFAYAARYGLARATGSVSVTVTADNSAYAPVISFDTLPALQPTTPIPDSTRVPGDFNGDGVSDLLWFNPGQSQVGLWMMSESEPTQTSHSVRRTGARVYNITPGYLVGASGDLTGDGYADLVFTSAARDLWLWTNSRGGGWTSTRIGTYPEAWQLVGAADVDGDGKDDLLWLNPSQCQFAYWSMNGSIRKGFRIVPIACGYYPVGVGYYTPSRRASVLWSSAANDLYVWDSQPGGFRSYNLTGALAAAAPSGD